jgi:ADP-heptose:LPS heptosyltransferase
VVGCDWRLLDLFRRAYPALVFTPKQALRYNVHEKTRCVEALDLLRIYNLRGNERAWLTADPKKVAEYRKNLEDSFPTRTKIGLSWASARAQLGKSKSIPLIDLRPLLGSQDMACLNLQYGNPEKDLRAIDEEGLVLYAVDGLDLKMNMDGVAALISALDYVVTSSNTVAHLAGALGKRTYLLVPGQRFVLWYWGRTGTTTPWYPSIQILRGPPIEEWSSLAEQVREHIVSTYQASEASELRRLMSRLSLD